MADRVAAGADYVKVVLEGGVPEIGARPTLDTATVRAVVDAAHGRDLLVIAHVGDRNDGRTAIEAGVDGLAHLFSDAPPDAALVDLAVRSGVFVVPTTPVTETFAPDGPTENPVLADERLARCLSVAERRRLAGPARRFPSFSLGIEQEGIRRFHEAGVPIVAGSDAPNPGTAYGASLHRELELLVETGLTPAEALTAGTAASADAFGLGDRGRIAEGLRADLVLVEGNPTEDVLATRDIVGVWKAGIAADRDRRCLGD